ncbi:ATP-binding protein [Nocardioides sp. T2.26MG-1]|uniref:ATP-binding protein n=1 Tax=Nocardioides sp. T2.26MG-1 TaxID=3041166 RepID=UPI002477589E|nr:ATP-binding protein [Nocardioides sp. T2.26MG-1]CAI9407164.1 Sensor histidine kinase RcsC [Nocardioides sp. T2.26MG-1]
MSPRRDQLSWPVLLALLAAVYGASTVAVTFAPEHGAVAAWWPGAGLAVVLVAFTPRRHWAPLIVAITVVCTLANLTGGRDLDVSAVFGAGDAAEALLAGALLRRGDRPPQLSSFEDLGRVAVAALIGALAIAVIAPLAVGVLAEGSVWRTARTVYTSHATSTLVIVPAALAAMNRTRSRLTGEAVAQAATLVAVTAVVFAPGQTLALSILPLPLLAWAALRLDLRTVTWEVVGFAVVVTYLSSLGGGPLGSDFESGDIGASAMATLVQAYLLCTAVVATPLALAMDLRHRLLERLTASERLFRRNFTESMIGMVLLRTGRSPLEIVDVNDAAARIIGGARTPIGRSLSEVLDTTEPLDLIATQMLGGNTDGWRAQTGLRDRPGARVNIAVSLLTTDPEPTYSAQLLDVTTEYDARRQLEAAEKLTVAALDTTAAMILVTDLAGVVVRVNRATTTVTGFAEDDLVGAEIWDMPFAAAGSSGYPAGLPDEPAGQVSRETDVVTRPGGRRRVLWNTGYVCDERDRPTYVVITGTDVTAERTAAGLNQHLLDAATAVALIGIDPRGRITLFNTGAVALLGHDPQDMVGVAFTDLLDPDELAERCGGAAGEDAFAKLVAGIAAGGETKAHDWTWVGADGRRHTVAMTLSVAADAFAARVGYLCVGRDVTEARASQELLIAALEKERLAVERLRQLDEAKNEFVSTVSHELRTPVTSIVGYTELLEDGSVGDPTPEQRPMLDSIARNGQRLILLCDDLLTLSGLDSGAAGWEHETIDLGSLLPSAEESVRPLLSGRDLELVMLAHPDPVLVLGDRLQLERVFTNLLGNAVKFTEDGGRIECRVARHDDEAWLTVSDTGLGIPAEEQSGLFQRFFRSSTAQDRAIQGTGLGLSIVAATVAAHGGRIDVESAHLEGTTFTVRLPLAR